ncbi:MAG: hypothetical protein ACI9T7_001347 [Oleiphilaceae bacterium]|jgi:hypothetical protein
MLKKVESNPLSSNELTSHGSLLVGKVVSVNDHGNPMIAYDETTQIQPIEALTTVPINEVSVGKDVAISFAQNQGGVPIVMGVIRRILDDVISQQVHDFSSSAAVQGEESNQLNAAVVKPEIIVDGNKLELSAADEITLRCGKSSITLNKNGKILIKGEHMLNRTSGSYKIKSGSIQLN